MGVGGVIVAVGMTFYEKIMPLAEGLAYAAVATGVAVIAVREWTTHTIGVGGDYLYFAALAYFLFVVRYLKHRRAKMRRERQKPIEFDLLSRKKD